MPEYVFHYTSRKAAQDIIASGYLAPGQSGKLYLTDDLYTSAAEAANRLAITGKPAEVVGLVPRGLIRGAVQPTPVRPLRRGRALWREGGGREIWISHPIPSGDIRWLELSAP